MAATAGKKDRPSHKRNCTIEQAAAVVQRHSLFKSTDEVTLCACGAWVSAPEEFTAHLVAALHAELAAYRPYRAITTELLEQVADAYRSAPARGRNAAVGELLGCSTQSASYYVSRARQVGLLDRAGAAGTRNGAGDVRRH